MLEHLQVSQEGLTVTTPTGTSLKGEMHQRHAAHSSPFDLPTAKTPSGSLAEFVKL